RLVDHVLGLAAPGVPELRIVLRVEARLSPSPFPTAAAFRGAANPLLESMRLARQVVLSVPHFLFFSFSLFCCRSDRLRSRGVGAVAPLAIGAPGLRVMEAPLDALLAERNVTRAARH
ncbi:MAG: hypothetical protein QOI41_2330, partial [Myxococcales bacterium]|nr:hypothetical protein [Myxococcales bacterium]